MKYWGNILIYSTLLCFHFLGTVLAFTRMLPRRSDTTRSTVMEESKSDLKEIAKQLNPLIGFWDPLGIVDSAYWGFSEEETIGWLRHAEIKHGRVAMAAFVGYCVQCHYRFPWAMTLNRDAFPSPALSPPEQWDAIPLAGKVQILLFIGFLEFWSELTPRRGMSTFEPHYTKGGKPGTYPPFDGMAHPVPFNLYDPFGLARNMNEKRKAVRLLAEINNGRLAMLGIAGILCEHKIPGSVPSLTGLIPPYAGEVMAPFEGHFAPINILVK